MNYMLKMKKKKGNLIKLLFHLKNNLNKNNQIQKQIKKFSKMELKSKIKYKQINKTKSNKIKTQIILKKI